MAVVTVNQASNVATSRFRPVPYLVQRAFRPGYAGTNDARRQTIGNLIGTMDATDTILAHWSGGNWQQRDFAPTNMGDTGGRQWRGTTNNVQGLDEVISLVGGNITYSGDTRTESDLKTLRDVAGHSTNRVMLVMQNHPQAMMPAGWPVQGDGSSRNWPRREAWGSGGAGTLATEVLARYGSMVRGFSYGQEMKEVANAFRQGLFPGGTLTRGATSTDVGNLSPNNWIDHIEGYNTFAKYMRAAHPTVELWMGHLDLFGHGGNETAAEIDAIIAGGSTLGNNADKLVNEMIDRIGRDNTTATFPALGTFSASLLPNAFTVDVSIASSQSTRWRNNYSAQISRIALEENVARIIYAKMQAEWGFTIPIVVIESYFDWGQDAVTFDYNQQAALSTGISMRALMGGVYEHARWEPQGGDLSGSPTFPYQYKSFASWWTPYNPDTLTTVTSPGIYTFPQFTQTKDLSNAFPPGTTMCTVSSDNASIIAVASPTKVFILNTSAGAISTSITATNGTVGAQSIPAYSHIVQTLPANSAVSAGHASGTGIARNASTSSSAIGARLTVRF